MSVSYINRLMPESNSSSYVIKQTCKFYLQVFISVFITFFYHQTLKG